MIEVRDQLTVFTVGHSTKSIDEFLSLIRSQGIRKIVDIRSYPGSRRYPHFNKERMSEWLPKNDIQYIHIPELGGRRNKSKTVEESLVAGWSHPAFRNYAAYTLTEEFEKGLEQLQQLARVERIAYMCSESVPWRCHRSIVSTNMTVHGWNVQHIMTEKKLEQHALGRYGATPEVHGFKVTYPLVSDQLTLVENS